MLQETKHDHFVQKHVWGEEEVVYGQFNDDIFDNKE